MKLQQLKQFLHNNPQDVFIFGIITGILLAFLIRYLFHVGEQL